MHSDKIAVTDWFEHKPCLDNCQEEVTVGSGTSNCVDSVSLAFFTSAKDVISLSLFVCLFVCLSVCLLATLRQNFQRDSYEIFNEC